MLETVYAQIRFAASILFVRPFHPSSLDRLVEGLLASHHEFGGLVGEANALLAKPNLDEAAWGDMQLHRFRTQAVRAAQETLYYAALFTQLGVNPKKLTEESLPRLPLTTKAALHEQPTAFICRGQRPTLRTMTTGTTGTPLSMYFTAREMDFFSALAALSALLREEVTPADIVQVSTSARGSLANTVFINACQRLGALAYQTGLIEPAQTLALLAEKHQFHGKKRQPSVMLTYPSYLGRLVTCGLRLGYRPADFSLERIILGGEIVTEGVKRRCQELFGPVTISEAYGITETYPFGGAVCEQGHLHFEPLSGLMEVIDPDSGRPVQPGQVGSLVLTPFAPFREAMILLRYDTQDLVRVMDQSCICSLKHLPATGPLLGKRRLAVHHADGWTCPREVLEALELIDDLPLPARCGFWALEDGMVVEVAVPRPNASLHQKIETSLQAHGVPVRALQLVTDPAQLIHPVPLRGDLSERSFTTDHPPIHPAAGWSRDKGRNQ